MTTQQPSLAFRETLDRARTEARDLGDQFVAVEHLLLASPTGSAAAAPIAPRCSRPPSGCAAHSAPTTRTPRSATTRSRASAAI